ncbi:sigma-54 dependent transcriptional regulator [Candidatus Albibeggiatoa sp. nov. NOAA]|uniref:sigma-54 interaction domain-containing protein n=1 Tax=Candidatus Albibeggiatoa sp. nov. NOAA TaxID=3162724 RepID=UPI0032F56AAB|nr:sigma-54 dependent transcriptional regulator [Thiotrichaceae bacterium]
MANAFKHLLGTSPAFANTLRAAEIVARTDATALLLGESGTGKELLAHAIHHHSLRADKPFIIINCAALPEQLVESELFGHRKGAFTGATQHQQGKIQAAQGGTLFLDEIGELPLSIQAKLLRFLESGECQPVGQQQVEKVDTRVIAATHRDLYALSQTGKFRQDLYYRLNIVPLELPPLRQRTEDISLLINAITQQLADKHQLSAPIYSKATLKLLKQHSWQGNIRELRNFCERMLILLSGQSIEPSNLPPEFQAKTTSIKPTSNPFELPETGIDLQDLEQQMIQQALSKTYGNRSQAARLLGLTRDTLLYRMKKYAIN